MEERLLKYIDKRLENLDKWDENKTLSDFGRGNQFALKEMKKVLILHGVGSS